MKFIPLAIILFLCNANGMLVDDVKRSTSDSLGKSSVTVLDTTDKVIDFFNRVSSHIHPDEIFASSEPDELIDFVQNLKNDELRKYGRNNRLKKFIKMYDANWEEIIQYLDNLKLIKNFIDKNGNKLDWFLANFSSFGYYITPYFEYNTFNERHYVLLPVLAESKFKIFETLRNTIIDQTKDIDISNAYIIYENYRIFVRCKGSKDIEISLLNKNKLKKSQINKSDNSKKAEKNISEAQSNKKGMR